MLGLSRALPTVSCKTRPLKEIMSVTETAPISRSYVPAIPGTVQPLAAIARYWSLIAIVKLGGVHDLIGDGYCTNVALLDALGISALAEDGQFDRRLLFMRLEAALEEASTVALDLPGDSVLARNVQCLAESLRLTHAEQWILLLSIIERQHGPLSTALDLIGPLSNSRLFEIIAHCLRLPEPEVRAALSPRAILSTTAMLRVDGDRVPFSIKFDRLPGITSQLSEQHDHPLKIFDENFTASPAPDLSALDYPHLAADLALLTRLLRSALASGTRGVNVLIYGPPGTGKTQFARVVAAAAGATMYEVAAETRHGHHHTSTERLASLQLSQRVLAQQPDHLLLLDEAEDIFSAGQAKSRARREPRAPHGKALMNRVLEENSLPTLWISNDISAMDPAYLRRFSFHLQLKNPPRSVRQKIVQQHAQVLGLSDACVRQLAGIDALPPSVMVNAVGVAMAAGCPTGELAGEQVVGRVVANAMKALGQPQTPDKGMESVVPYRPDLLNTATDLEALAEGLSRVGSARVCLYGPPGTGKTAFARFLAERLDRPLLARRASDLLDSFVGQTEQNMAAMFDDARREGAILLLDEADSFLMERRAGHRSWEISLVNEMLVQMEAFFGIFIASTNLFEQLDPAASRRFDAKVRFDYLRSEQACDLFHATCNSLGLVGDAEADTLVAGLEVLTPADVAAVVRQGRLLRIASSLDFARRLAAECHLKNHGKLRRVGF